MLKPSKKICYLYKAITAIPMVLFVACQATPISNDQGPIQVVGEVPPSQVVSVIPGMSELRVEEHELQEAPQVDPLKFIPLQAYQDDILKAHLKERDKRFPDHNFIDEGSNAMWVEWKDGKLIARETWDQANARMGVEVVFGERAIYSIELGIPSPINNLQGLWTYEDHWVLEVAGMSQQNNSEKEMKNLWVGQIIRDEVPLNEEYGYEESFGFQMMFGKPYYFFQKEGEIGYSYGGQEEILGYKQIPHYACCSGAELNPIKAGNMVAFFAQREEKWYYVEIGVFNQ